MSFDQFYLAVGFN